MRFNLRETVAAAAGVFLMDYLLAGIVPKFFEPFMLASKPLSGCSCGGGCNACAKNVTDRAQVIDVQPLNSKYVS